MPTTLDHIGQSRRWEAPDSLSRDLATLLHQTSWQMPLLHRCVEQAAEDPEIVQLLREMEAQETRWIQELRRHLGHRLGEDHVILIPEPW